jgi:ABC-2 type transport system permease protein
VIADAWLLTTLRWHLAWNTFKGRPIAVRILTVLGGLLLVLFGGGVSAAIGIGAGFLIRNFPGERLDALIPGAILTAVALLLLLSSFGVALGSLFLTSDLDLLMAAPVDRRAVFITKILDGMTSYYGLGLVIAFPALLTYGLAIGYGPQYYLLALVAILVTPLLPAGFGALLVMLVARFAPARRVREMLGLAGALVGLACGLIGQTSRFWADRVEVEGNGATTWLDTLREVANWPIPTAIAGRGLTAAGAGEWLPAAANLTGFLFLTLGFFALCVMLADRLYAAGWARMQSSGSAKRSRQRAERAARSTGLLGRAPAYMAIVLKDWRVVPRDLRNFAQMLSPLLFLPVVYLNILGEGRRGRGLDDLTFLGGRDIGVNGILISLGVLMATALVFARLTSTGISREGKSWWLLKAAPITGGELLRGKYLTALIPFVLLSSVLLAGAALWKGFDPLWFLYGWFGVEVLGAGLLALDTGLSVPWARLDWDDPRKMSSGLGVLISFIAWVLLGLVAGAFLCLPVIAEIFQPTALFAASVFGLTMASAISLSIGWLAFRFGASRVAMVGEG